MTAAPSARGERSGSLPWRSVFGESRLATASESAAPREAAASRQWAQVAGMNDVTLGALPPSPRAARSRDEGFRRWQPATQKARLWEWQPCFLRPKALRLGTESRRHRAWRERFRWWWPGDSENVVSCGGLAPPFENASPRTGVAYRLGSRRLADCRETASSETRRPAVFQKTKAEITLPSQGRRRSRRRRSRWSGSRRSRPPDRCRSCAPESGWPRPRARRISG